MTDLGAVQHWMQRAIFAGGAAPGFADEVVSGDARLTPAERVGIYAGGYRARLMESLRDEYRVLRLFAGDTAFDLFASGYVESRRSRDPSLYGFGSDFAGYLAERAPPEASESGSLMAVPAQLARIERARSECLRARGIEAERLPVTGDLALMPASRLRVPDSVRLLRLDFDFAPLLAAADGGEAIPLPEAVETRTAVARSGWRVRVHRLDAWRFAFLEALPAGNGDVHAAAAAAARGSGREPGAVIADLAAWLPSAGTMGLVAAV